MMRGRCRDGTHADCTMLVSEVCLLRLRSRLDVLLLSNSFPIYENWSLKSEEMQWEEGEEISRLTRRFLVPRMR